MIKVVKLVRNKLEKGDLEDLNSITGKTIWVDCVKPSDADIREIALKTGISERILKNALDEQERPRVQELKPYALIVYKAPFFKEDKAFTSSMATLISDEVLITLENEDLKSLERLNQLDEEDKKVSLEKGTSYFLCRILNEINTTYFNYMAEMEETIGSLEDEVFKKPDKKLVKKIFDLKKVLIYFHKALVANREVLLSIETAYIKQVKNKDVVEFNLHNDTLQLIEVGTVYTDLLTGALDVYLSSISNNLNEVMKKLTVIATFILMPTLIAGIYGMNFANTSPYNMPELYWKYGYFFSLGLMLFSIIVFWIYFKRKGWM